MKRVISALFASVVGVAGATSWLTQSVTLEPGWNAVYVGVSPDESADALFADWPVWSVSAYNAQIYGSTVSRAGGTTGEQVARVPYWLWTREAPQASTLGRLQADTVLVCFSTNATAFTAELRGEPAAPRIAWHVATTTDKKAYNIVGVRVAGQVKARDYFAGCPAFDGAGCYAISGPNDAEPRLRPLATGTKTALLNDGDVVFVPGSRISDWSGPLYIQPQNGLNFGEEETLTALSVRNDGVGEKTVRVAYVNGALSLTRPSLLVRGAEGWEPFTNTLARVLSTGETWTVTVALDRTQLAGDGATRGGLLRIEEDGASRMVAHVPVTLVDRKPASAWPQGLWEAKLSLTHVSFYQGDVRKDDVKAGGTMAVKVYVHVDAQGRARLLQRVTAAGTKEPDGSITARLYGPSATVPEVEWATRLSSAALPVDLPATEAVQGAFGDPANPLVFTYRIAADSPSNPFRHALHPLFDGKRSDFETPAPDGDDFANYTGTVKPELFSIGGEIRLAFDANTAAAWSPEETLGGTCTWTYTGVRREGPVVARGTLKLTRVHATADLNLN